MKPKLKSKEGEEKVVAEKPLGYSLSSLLLLPEKEAPWLRETCNSEFLPDSMMILLGEGRVELAAAMAVKKAKKQTEPTSDNKIENPSNAGNSFPASPQSAKQPKPSPSPRRPGNPSAGQRIAPIIAKSKTVKEFVMGLTMLGGHGEMVRNFTLYLMESKGPVITSRGFFFARVSIGVSLAPSRC